MIVTVAPNWKTTNTPEERERQFEECWSRGGLWVQVPGLEGLSNTQIAMAGALFASAIAMFSAVPAGFFPSSTRDQFVIDYFLPQGTDISQTKADLQAAIFGGCHSADFFGPGRVTGADAGEGLNCLMIKILICR